MMSDWKWKVSCYYADDVRPPKKPGELAQETIHRDDHTKDVEVHVAKSRIDIGKIEVKRL